MKIQICDFCKQGDKSIKSYNLPYYKEESVTGGWGRRPLTFEFGGEITPKAYDLCDKCAKRFFKANVSFLINVKELEEEHGIISFSVKYEDDEMD